MRKFAVKSILLLLVVAGLGSLCSCKKQTREEEETAEENKYYYSFSNGVNVTYELYNYLYMTENPDAEEIDYEDEAVGQSAKLFALRFYQAEKENGEYSEEATEAIRERQKTNLEAECENYNSLHLGSEYDLDSYCKKLYGVDFENYISILINRQNYYDLVNVYYDKESEPLDAEIKKYYVENIQNFYEASFIYFSFEKGSDKESRAQFYASETVSRVITTEEITEFVESNSENSEALTLTVDYSAEDYPAIKKLIDEGEIVTGGRYVVDFSEERAFLYCVTASSWDDEDIKYSVAEEIKQNNAKDKIDAEFEEILKNG